MQATDVDGKAESFKELKSLCGEDKGKMNERSEDFRKEHSVKKKDKHHKKSKKEKKKKSKKHKHEKNEDSSGSSQDSGEEWMEAKPSQSEKAWKIKNEPSVKKDAERDEWMNLDFMSLKATSVSAIRIEKQKEKALEQEKEQAIEKEKIQARELNPFWKDGGSGLPPAEGDLTSVKKVVHIEDGGLSWLRKAHQRMKEQSEREKRNLEDIIAERYGSVEIFQNKMDEAEKTASQNYTKQYDDRRGNWRRPKHYDNESRRFENQREDRTSDRDSRDYKGGRTRGEERLSDTRRSESEHRRYSAKPFGEGGDSKDTSSFRQKNMFLKPTEDDGGFKPQKNISQQGSLKNCFQKPAYDNGGSSWRKKLLNESREDKTPSKMEEQPISEREDSNVKTTHKPSSSEVRPVEEKPSSSSSLSSSRSDTKSQPAQILSEEDMNKLGAKLVKAELLGNMELASKLKAQLEEARKQKQSQPQAEPSVSDRRSNTQGFSSKEDQEVLLVRTDQSGRSWPVNAEADSMDLKGGRRKRQMAETHVDKERVRYFHDDDNQSLQDLVRKEKMGTAEDQQRQFLRMAAKLKEKTDQDYYTLDDMFVSSAAKKERLEDEEQRERSQAISEHRKLAARMEKCPYCFDNAELPKHLVISVGVKVYLSLPNHLSLTEGHCLIVPLQHYTASTLLDEDIWNEIQMLRKALVKMFEARGLDCVFLESNISLKKRFHLVYECIPLPKEIGDMAPIYFKKAIMESDEEWSMNKKLIDLSTKDIRRAVPKGLPYFSVDFGLQGGFAHVIEDQNKFPHYFGKEIIGGMLDLEPRVWRKAVRENFDDQRKKVLQFAQWWKPYDFMKTKEEQ
ncbi:CWF19-like protein 2 isoform 2-T2 [Discoglossus pictus]